EIRADVERDLTPLADETGGAPRAYGAHGRSTGVRRRGGVERLVRALAVRQLANRRDHVVRRGIDHLGGAELLGELTSLGCDVDGDDARPHLDGQLRRRQAHRALAEDGNRFTALQLDPSQRAPGRAGAAGDGGPGDEGERVRQWYQRRHRHLHVLRVAAVTAGAVNHRSLEAHLRPARVAVLAVAAAVVMVVHYALADPAFLVGDGGAHCRDDAAGLVTGDHAGRPLDATRDDSARIGR